MALPRWRRILDSRTLYCSIGIVTFTLLAASTAFAVVDAKLDLSTTTYRAAAIGAVILNCCALSAIIVLIASRLWRFKGLLHRWILPWSGALFAFAAAVISLNTLVLKKMNPKAVSESREKVNSTHIPRLEVGTEFTMWTLSVLAEIVFYALVIVKRTSTHDRGVSFSGEMRTKTSTTSSSTAPERPPTPPTPLRLIAPPYALPEAFAPAPAFRSTPREAKRSSWRDSLHSLHHAVRPVNSRTRLLISAPLQSISRDSIVLSDTRSVATTTHSDAFDTWDTSYVDLPMREALSPTASVPTRGTALETIPGSRPASPAKLLDGPFPAANSSAFVLERPPTAHSYVSRHERPGTNYSNLERPSTTHSNHSTRTFVPARSMSPTLSEAHIHPLFRTDSPTPPPGTSSGTTVTASPFGGHVLSPSASAIALRPSSRMRSNSRTSNRTISRAPSPAFKTTSMDDHRPLTCSSPVTESETPSFDEQRRSRSRSSSPVSRNMTPPIPEFILSASRETLRSTTSKETSQ